MVNDMCGNYCMDVSMSKELDPVLIFNSLNFVQSITKNYGAEQGMAMWDTIANTIDRRLKLEVFRAMMDGDRAEGHVKIIGAYPSSDKIHLIKTLRQFTKMGLAEAKKMIEDLQDGNWLYVTVPYHEHPAAIVEFRKAGFML